MFYIVIINFVGADLSLVSHCLQITTIVIHDKSIKNICLVDYSSHLLYSISQAVLSPVSNSNLKQLTLHIISHFC